MGGTRLAHKLFFLGVLVVSLSLYWFQAQVSCGAKRKVATTCAARRFPLCTFLGQESPSAASGRLRKPSGNTRHQSSSLTLSNL